MVLVGVIVGVREKVDVLVLVHVRVFVLVGDAVSVGLAVLVPE